VQNVASGGTTEDSVLVLQTHHVDVVEVQECCGVLIRLDVVLGEGPTNARRVVISLVRIVHREGEEASIPILRRNCAAQVGGERSDSAMTGKIIPDDRDPTGQGWLRVRSRPGYAFFRNDGTRADNFQKGLRHNGVR